MTEIQKLKKKLKKVESSFAQAQEKEQVVLMSRLVRQGEKLEKRIKLLEGDK